MTIYVVDGEVVNIYHVKDKIAKAVMTLLETDETIICARTHEGYKVAIVDKEESERKIMSDFKIVSKDAEVDPCYGIEAFYITKEEIAALLSGKKLYSTVNCDEYAITIKMTESEA